MLASTALARASFCNPYKLTLYRGLCLAISAAPNPCISAPINGLRISLGCLSPRTASRAYSSKKNKDKSNKNQKKNKTGKMDKTQEIGGVRIAVEGCVCWYIQPLIVAFADALGSSRATVR